MPRNRLYVRAPQIRPPKRYPPFSASAAAFVASIAESLTAADTSSEATGATGSVSEALTAADTSSELLASTGAVPEALSAADSESSVLGKSASIAEALTAAETESAVMSAAGSVTESLSAADTSSAILGKAASDAESGTAADSESVVMSAVAADVETLSASDTSAAGGFVVAQTETLSAVDTDSAVMSAAASIAESGNAVDTSSAAAAGAFNAIAAEALSAAETESATLSANRSVAESGSAAEIESSVMNAPVSASDALSTADTSSASATSGFSAVRAEALSVADASSVQGDFARSIGEIVFALDHVSEVGPPRPPAPPAPPAPAPSPAIPCEGYDSTTPGYLGPESLVLDDDALIDLYQPIVACIGGYKDHSFVVPRWQIEDVPNQPDVTKDWCSVGIRATRQDTFNTEYHVADGLGYDLVEYSEEIDLLISCYGPSSNGKARRLRDGFRLEQNRVMLNVANTDTIYCTNPVNLPLLLHGKWQRRTDITITLRRYLSIKYNIRTLIEASGSVDVEQFVDKFEAGVVTT